MSKRFSRAGAVLALGLSVACGQCDWIVHTEGFTAGTVKVDREGNVCVAAGVNSRSPYVVIKYGANGAERWRGKFPSLASNDVAGIGMGLDSRGNIYVAGQARSLPLSMSPWTIAKFKPDGTLVWNIDGTGGIRRMIVDAAGNVYTAGWGDAVKYDSDGRIVWHFESRHVTAMNVAADTSGNSYLVGSAGWRYGLVKVGLTGKPVWTAFYHDENVEAYNPLAVAVGPDGSAYVTGNINDEIATVKFDSTGQVKWAARRRKGIKADFEAAENITVNNENRIIVCGASQSHGDPAGRAVLTMAYESDGKELWVARHYNAGVVSDGSGIDLVLSGTGNIYVSPRRLCWGSPPTPVLKYDGHGNELWSCVRTNISSPNGLAVDINENVYVSGFAGACLPVASQAGFTCRIVETGASAAPRIVSRLRRQTVQPGQAAVIRVNAIGADALSYQWRANGVSLTGQTNAELVLRNASAASVGDYSVIVSNAAGAVVSPEARLILEQPVQWIAARVENGKFQAELNGETGALYEIQRSTNLVDWEPVSCSGCANSLMHFHDEAGSSVPQRFYRAMRKQ